VQQAAAEALLNHDIGPLARQAFYAALSTREFEAEAWMKDADAPGPIWQTVAAHRAPRWVAANDLPSAPRGGSRVRELRVL
jgi:hypothetical protein